MQSFRSYMTPIQAATNIPLIMDVTGDPFTKSNSKIYERHFPLHSIFLYCNGYLGQNQLATKGQYKTSKITNNYNSLVSSSIIEASSVTHVDEDIDDMAMVAGGAKTKLRSAFVFSPTSSSAGVISEKEISSNLASKSSFANSQQTLGFERQFYTDLKTENVELTAEQQATNSIKLSHISVELPDFNIKSYNGKRGGLSKSIHYIDNEDLCLSNNGTTYYSSQYPQPVDLHARGVEKLNSIRVKLCDPNGLQATKLIHPTNIVCRINTERRLYNHPNALNLNDDIKLAVLDSLNQPHK